MQFRFFFLLSGVIAVMVLACQKETNYEQRVKQELSKGIRMDSLFLGYEFGMTLKEYYDHSWKLNQKHLVTQAVRNPNAVQYNIDDELPYEATMIYMPSFGKSGIYKMEASISYDGWAPWNEQLSADSLLYHVKGLIEKKYGPGFFKVNKDRGGIKFVKIDANREIRVYKFDNSFVKVIFRDLSAAEVQSSLNALS